MIYLFKEKGQNFIYDINNSMFFEIEKRDWELLSQHTSTNMLSTSELQYICDSFGNKSAYKKFVQSIKELYNLGYLSKDDHKITDNPKQCSDSVSGIVLFITEQCNLRCIYCYEQCNNQQRQYSTKSISFDTFKKTFGLFIEESDRKHISISFFGGEATLYPEIIKEIVLYCNENIKSLDKTVSYSLTTNGMLLTPDFIDFINEHGFSLVVSCDGPEEIQDAQRVNKSGIGNYKKLMDNLRLLLQKLGPERITIRSTMTSISLDIEKIFNHFIDMGFISISIEPAIFPSDNPYYVTETALIRCFEDFAQTYCELKKQRPELHFFLFEQLIKRVKVASPLTKQCGIGSGSITIAPDGKIYPCQRLVGYEEMCLGNVSKGIENKSLKTSLANSYVYTKEECTSCWAKYICGGGCPAESYELFGSLNKANALKCAFMKRLIELSAWIYYNCYDIYNKDCSCSEYCG